MQAGLLKEWIVIEQETVTRDQYGGEQKTWSEFARTRARIQFKAGDQVLENREEIHTVTNVVTIRYRIGVTRQMRLTWGGEKYRILSIDRNRQEQSLVIKCELINE